MNGQSQPQSPPATQRRRIVFIYKDFKDWFSRNFMTGALAVFVAVVFSLAICFRHAGPGPYGPVFSYLCILHLLALVGWLCMVYWVSLMISRRLSGPLYRFEKTLDEIGQGNLAQQVCLRKDDRLQDFAASLNSMTDGLRRRVERMQTQSERLRQMAETLDAPSDLQNEIKRLAAESKALFTL